MKQHSRLIFDIETTMIVEGKWPGTIWMLVVKDIDTGEILKFSDTAQLDGSLKTGVALLNKAEVLIGHNILGFDCHVLRQKFKEFDAISKRVYDTFILSQLMYPDIDAVSGSKHSLDSWGQRLGFKKIKFDKFDRYSDEMLTYCIQDVNVSEKVFLHFLKDIQEYDWSKAIDLENKFLYYTSYWPNYWRVDVELLKRAILELEETKTSLLVYLQERSGTRVVKEEKEVNAFTKKGLPTKSVMIDSKKGRFHFEDVKGNYCRVDIEPLNLNSSAQVKDWLLSIGWKPDSWTYVTDDFNKPIRDSEGERVVRGPSLKDSSFIGIEEELAESLVKLRVVNHRLSTMQGWLARQNNGYLSYGMMTCACNTGRVQHRNIVNVPKAEEDVYYGKEMRAIFMAEEGYTMLGLDLDQIEAKLQGHFCTKYDNGKWAEFLLNNDIHAFNAQQWGTTRSKAKGPEYAMSYGCQIAGISEKFGFSEMQATNIFKNYWEIRWALGELKQELEDSLKQRKQIDRAGLKDGAWIKTLDGRKIFVRSKHSLINSLIQSAATIIAKLWTIKCCEYVISQDLDAKLLIFYHDEVQFQCRNEDVKKLSEKFETFALQSGEEYGITIPITSGSSVGNNWSETH